MSEVLLVLTNLPDVKTAEKLTQKLVVAGVAACVNQLAPCVSTYQWQGNIEMATEVPLLIKTTKTAYPRVEQLIQEHHPYELPEIIAVNVEIGLPTYLSWVANEVKIKE